MGISVATNQQLDDLLHKLRLTSKLTKSRSVKITAIKRELGSRFCRCIKKVKKNSGFPESSAIGICTDTVYHTKGLRRRGSFKCKGVNRKMSKIELIGGSRKKQGTKKDLIGIAKILDIKVTAPDGGGYKTKSKLYRQILTRIK